MPWDDAKAQELIALEDEQRRWEAENRLALYRPYAKQRLFHQAGATARERLLMAANQVGKSISANAETAMHLTGRYPDWWEGKRWDRPVRGWGASKTTEVTRDTTQRLLIGDPKSRAAWGTGFIPRDALVGFKTRQGVADALDHAVVRHVSGGLSTLGFKSYDQGREKWQGETLDFVAFDEEPPEDIYMEGLTRTNATAGIVWTTFTPLLGMSKVVSMFLEGETA